MTLTASPAATVAQIAGTIQLSQQAAWMERALAHYEGRPRKPLVTRPGEIDDSTIVSPMRLCIDKSVSFLAGQDIGIAVDGDRNAAAEDWLNLAWDNNRKTPFLQKAATNAALFGHVFIRPVPQSPWPKMVLLDSRYVDLLVDPDDLDTTWRITVTRPPVVTDEDGPPPAPRRTVVQNQSGAAGYKVDLPEQWEILDQVQQGGAWQTTASQDWPWPWCPISHAQNLPAPNSAWGSPDLPENCLHLCDVLNRVSSQIAKILRLWSHPIVYTTGLGQRNISRAVDAIIHLPSSEASMKTLEMQRSLTDALAYYDKLLSMLAAQARTPLIALGMKEDQGLGPVSGVALRIRYAPLLDKTEQKQETFGAMVTELSQHMLEMAGFGANLPVSLHWQSPLPADELAEAQTMVLHEGLGVSRDTVLAKLGYDPEEEARKKEKEQAAEPQPAVPPLQPLAAPLPDVAKGAIEDKQQAAGAL